MRDGWSCAGLDFPSFLLVLCVGGWVVARLIGPNPREVGERMAAAAQRGDPDPFAPASAFKRSSDRGRALWEAHRLLRREDLDDLALEALRGAASADPGLYMAELRALGPSSEDQALVLKLAEELGRQQPRHAEALRVICLHHIDAGDPEKALALLDERRVHDPELVLTRAHALIELNREREALLLLDGLVEELSSGRGSLLNAADQGPHARLVSDASSLAADLRRNLLGAEEAIRSKVAHRQLDPRAAVNHRLLAAGLMASSGRIARQLELQTVEQDEALSERLLAYRPRDLHGLCLRGLVALRRGQIDRAREAFEKARSIDGAWFPAALGYAAARTLSETRAWSALQDLPEDIDPRWSAVLPDLPALTAEERRVVSASATPLRALLPALQAAGAVARVLPLDVRPTDLPALSHLDGQFTGDRRALRGLGGVATTEIAMSRIEDLLDTVSDHSWVFAHELAHIARHHLPAVWATRLDVLYEEARAVPYALGQYQASNIDELFAVSYEGWLRARYERPNAPVLDREGALARIHALFDEIAATDALG